MRKNNSDTGKNNKPDKVVTLQNNSTISFSCNYPENNDNDVIKDIANTLKHAGVFDGINNE